MTEAEWLTETDPMQMLRFIRGKTSNRKLRLLTSACCRSAKIVLTCQPLRNAVETAERYADGQASYGEMVRAAKAVEAFSWSAAADERREARGIWHLVTMGTWWNIWPIRRSQRTLLALLSVERPVGFAWPPLFRCVFGSLMFRPVLVAPIWRTSTVLALAHDIYADRTFDRMPILADALQDAGCDNADILNHCRSGGPHVRGCWVVDLLLGKS